MLRVTPGESMNEQQDDSLQQPASNTLEPDVSPQNSDSKSADGLSMLSSVLNGLESGASAMRRQVQQAMRAVRAGTYYVDPIRLSKRIVRDCLGTNGNLQDCSF